MGNYPAVPTAGGDVGYLDNAAHYGIKRGTWEGAGGYANQYTSPFAPFIVSPGYSAPKGSAQYQPMIKGIIQTDEVGFAAAVSFGTYTTGTDYLPCAAISITGDGGIRGEWIFNPNDGSFYSQSDVTSGKNIVANDRMYESGGSVRVYSANNKPSASDVGAVQQGGGVGMGTNAVMLGWDGSRLIGQVDNTTMGAMYCEFNKPTPTDVNCIQRDACDVAGFAAGDTTIPYMRRVGSNEIVRLATYNWASQNFISSISRGAQSSMVMDGQLVEAPAGCVLTGGNGNEGSQIGYALYRPLQMWRNGGWVTIDG